MNKKGKYAAFLTGIAVLGGGAYTVTGQLTTDGAEKTGTASSAPVLSGATAASDAMDAGSTAKPAESSAAPGPTISLGKEAMERLAAAKKAGEKMIKTQRALPQPLVTEPVQVWEEGSVREKGKLLRVTSARQDLTGYRELGWIADFGERVGSSSCTQKLKMSNEAEPRVRPTMLLCWRLSPKRSVYTIMIDLKKKPSKQESVARIDKTWAEMS